MLGVVLVLRPMLQMEGRRAGVIAVDKNTAIR